VRVHLYTADEVERTFIEENLDNYVFEGEKRVQFPSIVFIIQP